VEPRGTRPFVAAPFVAAPFVAAPFVTEPTAEAARPAPLAHIAW
jgi:hypothetical protein